MQRLSHKHSFAFMALCVLLTACGAEPRPIPVRAEVSDWRPQQEVPRSQAVDVAQIGDEFERPKQSPLFTYMSAGDFKAVATNENGVQGAGASEQSLFIAEREAVKDCTRRSEYQGKCEVAQVGTLALGGSDAQKDQQRWRYLRSVHQVLAGQTPARVAYTAKVLAPGSRVGDATLTIASSFETGGYATLLMPGYACSGTLDPIDQSRRDVENEDQPIGLLEMACQTNNSSGQLLYGGYASVDAQTKLFYLEDDEKERWEFLVAPRVSSVGYNTILFRREFRRIEEQD